MDILPVAHAVKYIVNGYQVLPPSIFLKCLLQQYELTVFQYTERFEESVISFSLNSDLPWILDHPDTKRGGQLLLFSIAHAGLKYQ